MVNVSAFRGGFGRPFGGYRAAEHPDFGFFIHEQRNDLVVNFRDATDDAALRHDL